MNCVALHVALVLGVLVFLPITLYLHLAHPAWSFLHYVSPNRAPKGVLFLVWLGELGLIAGGFGLGYHWIRSDQRRRLLGAIGVTGLLALALLVAFSKRWGRYAIDDSGTVFVSLWQTKLGYALPFLAAAWISTLLYAGYQLHVAGRRLS